MEISLLRFTVVRLSTFCLAFVQIFAGCGDDEITIQTVDSADEWIGAWQYMRDKDGVLVPDGNRKILFTPEGTWQLSHDDETGTYIVFEGRFHIDPSGSKNKTGGWVRDGNILKLAYDDTTIRILQRTESFQKYKRPPPPPPLPPPETGNLAPNFTLASTELEEVSLSDYEGKVVLLDFWATWCKPCEEEIPIFIDLYDQYRARGFEMLGISLDEDGLEVIKPFIERLGVNYTILLAEPGIVEQYKLTAIPSAYLINRNGRIVQVFDGAQGEKAIYEMALQKLL